MSSDQRFHPLTRRRILAGGAGLASGLAVVPGFGQGAAASADGVASAGPAAQNGNAAIKPGSILSVDPEDGMDRIIAKAANVVPRAAQVAWQQQEITAFTHFGMNTFTNREWGSGMEDEARFNPSGLDIAQWMRTYKALGAKQVMLVAKHHDGFVLYPTRYTPHSVASSPFWGNPDGDILASYVREARAAGLNVGVYLSPADGAELPHDWFANVYVPMLQAKPPNQLGTNEAATLQDLPGGPRGLGRYGNGSAIVPRTIPTLVENDDRASLIAQGKLPTFQVNVDDYNAYYLNQLYELFTQYGPINELWLDGANPWSGSGVTETYDFTAWFDLIHQLSPDTVTFAGPQGTRWVGNESGSARTTEWSVVADTVDPATTHGEGILVGGAQANDLGSRLVLATPTVKFVQWFPAEADVSIRPGWFYHPTQSPKTPNQLVTIFQNTVGRNAVMLLNIPPNPEGQIAAADVNNVTSFGDAIRATYATNLLAGNARDPNDEDFASVTDGQLDTSWSPPHGSASGGRPLAGTLALELASPVTFNQIRLGEDITQGQQVEQFAVDTWNGSAWVRATTGTTIGYSRILVLANPITTDRLRVKILDARSTPCLAFVGLYRTVAPQ